MRPPEPPRPRYVPTAQALQEVHRQRAFACAVLQAALVIPPLLFSTASLRLLGGPSTAHGGWVMLSLLLAILGQWVMAAGRYLTLFHTSLTKMAQLFLAHGLAGFLISAAFNLATEDPENHYRSVSLLSAVMSSVALAVSYTWGRGGDVGLPDYRRVISPPKNTTVGGTATNYQACLWPAWLDREVPWKVQAKALLRDGGYWLLKYDFCCFAFPMSVMVWLACGPYMDGVGWASRKVLGQSEDPNQWLDKATRPWVLLWLAAFIVASYIYISFTVGTEMLSHVLLQPLDFTQLSGVDYLLDPQIRALSLGWEPVIQDSTGGGQAAYRPPDLPQWRKELHLQEEALLRIAALVDTRYFPPVVNSHNNSISVADKISRALAFMDLAIFTEVNSVKRRHLYRNTSHYQVVIKVLLAVINSLTLQLEMHLVAMSKVKGGPASALDTLHARAGVDSVVEGESIAKLLVEAELQKRLGRRAAMRGGEEVAMAMLLSPRELSGLDLALLDIQVVELAIRSLENILLQAYNKAGASMEDSQGACRHTVPSAVNSLLALQIAIHLYSGVKAGDQLTRRFLRLRDRDSVVLPPFRSISLAIDQVVEGVIQVYHDSDFTMYAFPPLYAKCLQAFIRGRNAAREDEMTY